MRKTYFSVIRNPMTIIALFVVLVEVALGLTVCQVPERFQRAIVVFLLTFPVICAIGFFATLLFRPQHFYGPRDFRSDESYLAAAGAQGLERVFARADEKRERQSARTDVPTPPGIDAVEKIIINAQPELLWYLAKVANRPMTIDDHVRMFVSEGGFGGWNEQSASLVATGFLMGIANMGDFVFEMHWDEDDGLFEYRMSAQVLDLIMQTLRQEIPEPEEDLSRSQ